jgi:arginine decarboxylase
MSEAKNKHIPKKDELNTTHYNIHQLRIELWNDLKTKTRVLARTQTEGLHQHDARAEITTALNNLGHIEQHFAFPGHQWLKRILLSVKRGEWNALANQVAQIVRLLVSDGYRNHSQGFDDGCSDEMSKDKDFQSPSSGFKKNYFEVLFVEDLSDKAEADLRSEIKAIRDQDEDFVYDLVIQRSFQEAMISLLFNFNIQAVVVAYAPPFQSVNTHPVLNPFIQEVLNFDFSDKPEAELGPLLAKYIHHFRPELDIYYITDTALTYLKDSTMHNFRRIFYRREDIQELHLAILQGIKFRFETPFFTALKEYSKKPTGVFHAMPISRGNSIFKSRWINDFGDFYGRNLFLAETSATTGGLDSLLQPTGTLKQAQERAARAYGAEHTYFVTNGTSTANKIVQQALIQPNDLVLIDRDCHKSHHYGLVLAGAYPVYLDSYPIEAYSMYGAVPLELMKSKLLELKAAGRLDKVKMLLLTNCTFDGIVYNVERVMEEVLAIKPDMIFLWDEAWFAFAGFTYTYKQRTGMFVAKKLFAKYHHPDYIETYNNHLKALKPNQLPLLPDPEKVKIRVYSTQSTHKTLSSFRQGSMIHVWDEEFRRCVSDNFHEAYMTHTSTSPNYQILASLDAGRRQVQFEGYEMVGKSIEMAMILRAKIQDHPKLRKYFDVLTIKDFIPAQYRSSGLEEYYHQTNGWSRMEQAWEKDEFVLDPTKITLAIGKTGIDGDTFKNKFLMDRFNLQINKTSRNTILLMTNIGTTRGSVAYLMNALLQIATELDEHRRSLNQLETDIENKAVLSLTEDVPPLPHFSRFHASFQALPGVSGGNIRAAYFLAYNEDNCEYIPLQACLGALKQKQELVSTSFVIPYPPGFPVLVPGQVISEAIIQFLLALDVTEIHGYRAELGLKVFSGAALEAHQISVFGKSLKASSPQHPSKKSEKRNGK